MRSQHYPEVFPIDEHRESGGGPLALCSHKHSLVMKRKESWVQVCTMSKRYERNSYQKHFTGSEVADWEIWWECKSASTVWGAEMVTGPHSTCPGGLSQRGGGLSGSKAADPHNTEPACWLLGRSCRHWAPCVRGALQGCSLPFHRHRIIGCPGAGGSIRLPSKVLKTVIRFFPLDWVKAVVV